MLLTGYGAEGQKSRRTPKLLAGGMSALYLLSRGAQEEEAVTVQFRWGEVTDRIQTCIFSFLHWKPKGPDFLYPCL